MTQPDDKGQQPEAVYVWWSDIEQRWRIRKWDMQSFVEGTKYVRVDLAIPSHASAPTDVPLCAGHADWWFTSRNHLKGNLDCVVCAFQPAIEEAARSTAAAPSFYCAAGGCESQCMNCADESPAERENNVPVAQLAVSAGRSNPEMRVRIPPGTPRTDALDKESPHAPSEWVEHGKQLERELAEQKRLNAGLIDGIAAHKAALSSIAAIEIQREWADSSDFDKGYVKGWNACRDEALKAAPSAIEQNDATDWHQLYQHEFDRRESVERLPADILALCKLRGWNLHWTHRGAYLHLESSELIEALRGKRGDPLHEAADVLLVLMSITENAGLLWTEVLKQARATCEELKTRPRYRGEEFSATDGRTDIKEKP